MRRLWPLVILVAGPFSRSAGQTPAAASVHVFGYVQPRFQAVGDSAVFFLRRARFGAQGAVASWASYRVQAELRAGGDTAAASATVELTDAWVAAANAHWSAMAGQFKTPFSRELLQPASTLELAERTLVVDALAPSRDVGAMVEWRGTGNTALRVQGGAFNGEGANRAANPDGRLLFVGRAVAARGGVEIAANLANDNRGTRWGADGQVQRGRWLARGEFLTFAHPAGGGQDHGGYLFGAYALQRNRAQLVARVETYTTSAPLRTTFTGYGVGGQYFFRGDDLKLQAAYTVYDTKGPVALDNRLIVQMQARF